MSASVRPATDTRSPGGWADALPPLTVLLLTAMLIWPVVARAVAVWSSNEALIFGFMVPPLVAFLVWWRRASLRRRVGPVAAMGLLLVVVGVALLVLCER